MGARTPAPSPYIADADFVLHVGDVRDVLQTMPDESVHCVVTSPPYWGLRDYGTGAWDGGDVDCDHTMPSRQDAVKATRSSTLVGSTDTQGHLQEPSYRDVCGKCGARRVDQQLGLEPTPDEYVSNMVAVFHEVRRVLRRDGTCWLNIGDSYNNRNMTRTSSHQGGLGFESEDLSKSWTELKAEGRTRMSIVDDRLKEKDLVGVPWLLAFALQADGWYLRADIIWSKPNPMPESVTDRPTKAHEYVFLLTRSPKYFFDQEAVREPSTPMSILRHDRPAEAPFRHARMAGDVDGQVPHHGTLNVNGGGANGRNVRSVWEIATQPYAEAHFATFPEALVERCVKAGTSERGCCPECGAPWEREVERGESDYARLKREQGHDWTDMDAAGLARGVILKEGEGGQTRNANGTVPSLRGAERKDKGWIPAASCACGAVHVSQMLDADVDKVDSRGALPDLRSQMGAVPSSSVGEESGGGGHRSGDLRSGVRADGQNHGLIPVPCTVLDPFMGSGTTALVARRLGRKSIGIELNEEYARLAAKRLQQLSLLSGPA